MKAKRKRRRLGDSGEACPVYAITVEPFKDNSGADAVARIGGKRVGAVTAMLDRVSFQVQSAEVSREHQRCGLGTKLYTALARWGCGQGMHMGSDSIRTEDSQGFWAKQERKGRARCTHATPEKGQGSVRIGRGGCATYQLTSCPVTDLSGRRRRR